MKEFKLMSVTHSGADGKRGAPRIEPQYTGWLGAIVSIDKDSVKGEHLVITDVFDMDWDRTFESDDVITLRVYKKTEFKNTLTVETETTIYTFEELW